MGAHESFPHRLQLLADSAEDIALVITDTDGRITHWSRGAGLIFGRAPEDAIGRPVGDLFVPEDRERGMDVLEREAALRNKVSMDDRWQLRGDGSRFWATGAMVPLLEGDRHVGFGKVLFNRTDLKVQIETLRNGIEELEAMVQGKDVFLSTLSHELRNPLAPVANAVAILRRTTPGSGDHAFALGVIDRQMAMLQRLVDDLLDLTRVGAGKIDIKLGKCPVQRVMQSAIDSVQPLIQERRHSFELIASNEPIHVKCDAERLEQVFVNLLTNAAKYTPPGGIITATIMLEGNEVAIRVEDNGIGIPTDMLPHIFDMFTQVDSARALARGGLGIGLALVKNLVTLQGGIVQVRSDGVGKGSQFTVRLPAEDEALKSGP